MKIIAPATAIRQEKLKERLKHKRKGIRVIDEGTLYDIPGQLKKAAREMEKTRDVTDVLLITRKRDGSIGTFHWGQGGRDRRHMMACTAQNRIEPA